MDVLAPFVELSGEECENLLSSNGDLTIIDVRSWDEYASSRIPGARHIDILKPYALDIFGKLNPQNPYLIYCSIGVRSKSTLMMLQEEGFHKVYHLTNGLTDYSGTLDYSRIHHHD